LAASTYRPNEEYQFRQHHQSQTLMNEAAALMIGLTWLNFATIFWWNQKDIPLEALTIPLSARRRHS
jgi:hypothetical protein